MGGAVVCRPARLGGVCDGILACNRLACFTTRRDIIIKRGIIVSLGTDGIRMV